MDEAYEYILKARLVRREVLVADVKLVEPPHQLRDAAVIGMTIEAIAKGVTFVFQR